MKWVRRILFLIVALPVLLLVGLLLAGQRTGAGRHTAQVTIARSPERVFLHLEDENLLREWTGVSEIIRHDTGPLRPGSRSRMVLISRGQRTELDGEVTALQEDRLLAFVLKSAPGSPLTFTQTVEYRLEPKDDASTILRVVADTNYSGFVTQVTEPLITPVVERQLQESLGRLKAQVEQDRVPR